MYIGFDILFREPNHMRIYGKRALLRLRVLSTLPGGCCDRPFSATAEPRATWVFRADL